jgi:hypothetical protein
VGFGDVSDSIDKVVGKTIFDRHQRNAAADADAGGNPLRCGFAGETRRQCLCSKDQQIHNRD